MDKDNKKVVYYVLGAVALATGVYLVANKELVKNGWFWVKNLINLNNKKQEDGE